MRVEWGLQPHLMTIVRGKVVTCHPLRWQFCSSVIKQMTFVQWCHWQNDALTKAAATKVTVDSSRQRVYMPHRMRPLAMKRLREQDACESREGEAIRTNCSFVSSVHLLFHLCQRLHKKACVKEFQEHFSWGRLSGEANREKRELEWGDPSHLTIDGEIFFSHFFTNWKDGYKTRRRGLTCQARVKSSQSHCPCISSLSCGKVLHHSHRERGQEEGETRPTARCGSQWDQAGLLFTASDSFAWKWEARRVQWKWAHTKTKGQPVFQGKEGKVSSRWSVAEGREKVCWWRKRIVISN